MNEDDAPDISQLVRDYMENRIEMEKLRTESYQIRQHIYNYKKVICMMIRYFRMYVYIMINNDDHIIYIYMDFV